MSAIGPGDWVECVDAAPRRSRLGFHPEERVFLGAIYQVSDCWVDRTEGPVVLVGKERVHGSLAWGERVGYAVNRFRPIYRPQAGLIESLSAPVTRTPKVVREGSRDAVKALEVAELLSTEAAMLAERCGEAAALDTMPGGLRDALRKLSMELESRNTSILGIMGNRL